MLKVSIITVVFNAKETIESTIKSVLSQSYRDIEYIIIDGGSTDGTLEIVTKYKSKVNFLLSEPDKGLYDAMNKGIAKSTGDVIGILNADDVFADNHVILNIVEVFLVKGNIDATVGNVNQRNKYGAIARRYSSKNWTPRKLKFGFMPPHPSIFFKRKLFDKFGDYNVDFKIAGDYELITRFFLKNDVNWYYSRITTTDMLLGGVSSSGIGAYNVVSKEIQDALRMNSVGFSSAIINCRVVWKILSLIRR